MILALIALVLQVMAKRRSPEVPALPIPKKTRSGFHGDKINYGPISSPAPATMRASTRATATGEAIVTSTPAPADKGKEIATSCENSIQVLADASLTFEAMLTYASGLEKLLQDFNKAILNYFKISVMQAAKKN